MRRTARGGLCLGALVGAVIGCSAGAQLLQETDSGGVVAYLYKEERGGPAASRYRKDALDIMNKKCPQGYTVVKEGETRGVSGGSSLEGAEDEPSRRWAFQFRCKNG
jgi:formylmethanofuran dehydrogenase subunit E